MTQPPSDANPSDLDDRGRDIFDPFDHGGAEVPNLLRPEDARMLSYHAAHMITDDPTNLVDPDEAVVVEAADTTDHRSRTLAIVGAPGSGKSTVGRLVAELLELPFCDVDSFIEQNQGKPVGDIFADDGEPAFRRMEEEATVAALQLPQVVSLGGGAVMSAKIRAALAPHPVVWLEVQAATAIARAGLNQARPLLLGNVRGTLIKLLAERTPVYRALATVIVANDGDDPEATARQVVAELAQHRLAHGGDARRTPEGEA